ncbi:MAG: hypothetical protein AB9836_04940 [Aminipila sp.]
MKTNLIKCKFIGEDGQPKGRDYFYYCELEVETGDKVIVLNPRGQETDVIVTAVDMPLENVETFKDKVKHVIRKAEQLKGAEPKKVQ